MAGISDRALKANYAENKYRFNGADELQNKEFGDGSGLELYSTDHRLYDPQLGRFSQTDPYGDKFEQWSPYNFAIDAPSLLNDPDGLQVSDSTHPQALAPATVKGHRSRSTINAVTVDIRPLTRNRNYVLGGNQPFLVNYSPAKKGANLTIAKQTVKLSGIVISIVPVGRGVKALYSLYRLNQLFEEAKIPETAGNVADNALNKNGATLRGWKGGSLYANDGRSGGEILPEEDADGNPITYKEYDVWPKVPGQNRGGERVIVGSDNSAYYINNHYQSFTQIRGN